MPLWVIFLIGVAVGWLAELLLDIAFWRNRRICTASAERLHSQAGQIAALQAELNVLRSQGTGNLGIEAGSSNLHDLLQATRGDISIQINGAEVLTNEKAVPNSAPNPAPFETNSFTGVIQVTRKDNLEDIWGIGVQLEKALYEQGVFTYAQLCDEANNGRIWNALKATKPGWWKQFGPQQDEKDDTRAREAFFASDFFRTWKQQICEKANDNTEAFLALKKQLQTAWSERALVDLEKIWGVGPVLEKELYAIGIHSLDDLSKASWEENEVLQNVLKLHEKRLLSMYKVNSLAEVFAHMKRQAELGAKGDWTGLMMYQIQHFDRKRPLRKPTIAATPTDHIILESWQWQGESEAQFRELQRQFLEFQPGKTDLEQITWLQKHGFVHTTSATS
ncbi:MAG: hypothetical protein D6706_14140 [Chloroflexi bacterium]|nr:MAG: hypothetical protein D6706_14140 [Chloroflexota bacterium]